MPWVLFYKTRERLFSSHHCYFHFPSISFSLISKMDTCKCYTEKLNGLMSHYFRPQTIYKWYMFKNTHCLCPFVLSFIFQKFLGVSRFELQNLIIVSYSSLSYFPIELLLARFFWLQLKIWWFEVNILGFSSEFGFHFDFHFRAIFSFNILVIPTPYYSSFFHLSIKPSYAWFRCS
jgi:hypothetical protein